MRQEEKIEVPKQTMNVMIKHFEILIRDFEKLAEKETMRKVDKRLEDIKKGIIKGYFAKDYSEFLKRKGVNVQ